MIDPENRPAIKSTFTSPAAVIPGSLTPTSSTGGTLDSLKGFIKGVTEKPTDSREEKMAKWNTENLTQRLGADVAAAGLSAALVAPIIGMIDK
jgi:hypothetical protein